jgi:hypothetical protein
LRTALNVVNNKNTSGVILKPIDSVIEINPLTDLIEEKRVILKPPKKTILKQSTKQEVPSIHMPTIKNNDSIKEWAETTR